MSDENSRKSPEKGNQFSILGRKVKVKTPEIDSKAYAALAAASGAGMAASNFLPPLKPLASVFRGAAMLSIGAADAKTTSEKTKIWENHKAHAHAIGEDLKKQCHGKTVSCGRTLEDYVRLSFLPDKYLNQFSVPVRAEVAVVQILLGLDALNVAGGQRPDKELDALGSSTLHLHTMQGVERLRAERDLVRESLKKATDAKAAADAKGKEQSPGSGLVKFGLTQAVNAFVKKHKYGNHLSTAFNLAESAQILKDSARIIALNHGKAFNTPDEYVGYLVQRIESMREQKQPAFARIIEKLTRKL